MKQRAAQGLNYPPAPLNTNKLGNLSTLLDQSSSEYSFSPERRSSALLRRRSNEAQEASSKSWKNDSVDSTPRTSRRYESQRQSSLGISYETSSSHREVSRTDIKAEEQAQPSEDIVSKLKSASTSVSEASGNFTELKDILTTILCEIKGIKTRMTHIEERMSMAQSAFKSTENE
mmetsp:Transcript_6528/g.11432  ORF Transcript_6528/g.11432 Transcript_6528/m.11432 type:complete len:175 (-) Transcript_6528:1418-1942(-)